MKFPHHFFTSSSQVVEEMLADAEICLKQGKPERAFATYKKVVELTPNATAQYNLGALYATGSGTEQDFLQAAYWFHQAALNGDANAGKLETRSFMDYIHQGFAEKTPLVIYQEAVRYEEQLDPRRNSRDLAVRQLTALGEYHLNKKEYAQAAKLFRAAAEYGNDGTSQNYLGVLYNAGAGVEKNDLAALYWFDRASDNHIEASATDRAGILNAYRSNLSPSDFYEQMEILAAWCMTGSEDIPPDAEKAAVWRAEAVRNT